MNTIIDTIKSRFKNATIIEQFIYINLSIFILVYVFNTFGFLFQLQENSFVNWFALPANFNDILFKPWTIITYGFLHLSFFHLLSNLILLYFIGNLFTEYFDAKTVISFYVLGTFFGGLLFIISYNFFPVFKQNIEHSILMGASAGVYAILVGIATHIPNYQFKIPLIGFVKLWHIAASWIILDIIQIPIDNAGGHIAHLGGALFGYLYVKQYKNTTIDIIEPFKNIFKKKEKSAPLKTVYNSGNKMPKSGTFKTIDQKKVDLILDKISKSGYDTLTPEEKEFLFKQGKN